MRLLYVYPDACDGLLEVWSGSAVSRPPHLGTLGLAGVKARYGSPEGPAHPEGPRPASLRPADFPPRGDAGQLLLVSAPPAAAAGDVSAASVETTAGRGRRK